MSRCRGNLEAAVDGVLEILALGAAVLVAVAYVPQVLHTWRTRCCVGISLPAWTLWLATSIVFLFHAINIGDTVFSALMAVQLAANVTIVTLALKHRGHACELHGGPARSDAAARACPPGVSLPDGPDRPTVGVARRLARARDP